LEKKAAEKKETRNLKRQKLNGEETGEVEKSDNTGIEVEAVESQRRKGVSIGECEDVEVLQEMLERPLARGKK